MPQTSINVQTRFEQKCPKRSEDIQHPDWDMKLAATEGLPNLGGAKVEFIFGDHGNSPEKGIAEAEISRAVREAFGERDAREVAGAAAARKLQTLRGVAPEVARRRLGAFLTRKGFAVEIVLALCRKYFPHGEDPNDPMTNDQ
jgi:hypothetical protein